MTLILPGGAGGGPSFPSVTASTLTKHQFKGRNKPILLNCFAGPTDLRGLTCVVKLRALIEQKEHTFWCEWVAGLLADELGVYVPPRYVVDVPKVVSVQIAKWLHGDKVQDADLTRYMGDAFGVEYLTPTQPIRKEEIALEEPFREDAACIAVFDAFIDNGDRLPDNPNCLLDASSVPRVVAIDHDLAFSGIYLHILTGGLPWPQSVLNPHLFTRRFGTKVPSVAGIKAKIAGLSDGFLDGLAGKVPPLWLGASAKSSLQLVIDKLKERRNTIEDWFPDVEAWVQS